jgi:hypothetical protein
VSATVREWQWEWAREWVREWQMNNCDEKKTIKNSFFFH